MKKVIISSLVLAACGSESNSAPAVMKAQVSGPITSTSLVKPSAAELPVCEETINGQLIWLSQEKEFRTCNAITGNWDVVSIVGANGRDGKDGQTGGIGAKGETGASCTVTRGNGGANVKCGDQTVFVADGAKGDKGDQGIKGDQGERGLQGLPGIQGPEGQSCGAERVTGGVNIVCGNTTRFLADGAKGEVGAQGLQGIQGIQGVAGANAPILSVQQLGGWSCANGAMGTIIQFWYDTNLNGGLDDNEYAISEEMVCNGVKGDKGDQGIQGVAGVSENVRQPVLYVDNTRVGVILGEADYAIWSHGNVYQVLVDNTNYVILYGINIRMGRIFSDHNGFYAKTPGQCQTGPLVVTEYYSFDDKLDRFQNVVFNEGARQDNTSAPWVREHWLVKNDVNVSVGNVYGTWMTHRDGSFTCATTNAPVTVGATHRWNYTTTLPTSITRLATQSQNAEIIYE